MNASGAASKQGFAAADLANIGPAINDLKHVQVRGLMTMAALQEPEACRPTFAAAAATLRDQLQRDLATRIASSTCRWG